MIKAVFFDLDDTLVDSYKCHVQANMLVFQKFGIKNYDQIRAQTQNQFIGKKIIELLEIRKNLCGIDEQKLPLKTFAKEREKIFLKLVTNKSVLISGAIHALNEANKCAYVAIVSSGTRKYIFQVINQFHLKSYIDFFVGEEDVTRGKPFPDSFNKAYDLLPDKSIRRDECLVVEDSNSGIIAASDAQMKSVFIPSKNVVKTNTVRPDYELKSLHNFHMDIFI